MCLEVEKEEVDVDVDVVMEIRYGDDGDAPPQRSIARIYISINIQHSIFKTSTINYPSIAFLDQTT